MSALYVDTSALIKRYMTESGSNWIKTLLNPANGNVIIVCDLTAVEVFSTLARRQREKTISRARVQILQSHFLVDFEREYLSLALKDVIVVRARDLITKYPLRSLDALQLSSAIEATNILGEQLTFLSADKNLLAVAASNGFQTDDPNNHP
ncbi:MAG TPA: type II toxin-antitoxin system VapC family toxin [Phototrophicaceae bacterium]|nr:type II toxin-antitoxin system VapC family toxin [Phototrophicaceae bacterium]